MDSLIAHPDDICMAESIADALAPTLRPNEGDAIADPVRLSRILACALSSIADDCHEDEQSRRAHVAGPMTDLGDVSSPRGDALDTIAGRLLTLNV